MAATERELTDFEQVLLGTVAGSPSSGYDLKRLFATTPAVVYQPSPGTLYPALRRLEARGELRAERVARGGRERLVYHATRAGLATHRRWLSAPMDPRSVGRDLGLHLMRFVMLERFGSPEAAQAFLADLAAALEAFVETIEQYVASTPLPGRHPRLALEHGIAVHRASLQWATSAAASLSDVAPVAPPSSEGGGRSLHPMHRRGDRRRAAGDHPSDNRRRRA